MHIAFTITGKDMLYAGLYMLSAIIWYMIIFTTDIGFSGEWRNNTMKNTVSYGTGRNIIFFGKCIINFLILLMGTLFVSAAYLLSNYICFRNDGSLTASTYGTYFFRLLLMIPLIIAGQTVATSLCMFFSTDLLWCGIYAVLVTLLPNGVLLLYALFPDNPIVIRVYENLPTTCLTRISYAGWDLEPGIIPRMLIISAVMLIIFMPVSLLVFNKKEIK
jgi:hypothetical protein